MTNNVKNFFAQPEPGADNIGDNALVLGGTMNASGAVNSTGTTTLSGPVTLSGTVTMSGTMNATGDVVASSNLEVTAAGELKSLGDFTGTNGTVAAFVADGSDAATTQTLANAVKAILIDIGAMAPS